MAKVATYMELSNVAGIHQGDQETEVLLEDI
jgi:hypothetical protein